MPEWCCHFDPCNGQSLCPGTRDDRSHRNRVSILLIFTSISGCFLQNCKKKLPTLPENLKHSALHLASILAVLPALQIGMILAGCFPLQASSKAGWLVGWLGVACDASPPPSAGRTNPCGKEFEEFHSSLFFCLVPPETLCDCNDFVCFNEEKDQNQDGNGLGWNFNWDVNFWEFFSGFSAGNVERRRRVLTLLAQLGNGLENWRIYAGRVGLCWNVTNIFCEEKEYSVT